MWDPQLQSILREALQLSLELEHENCVKVLIQHKAPVKDVGLLELYDKLFDKANPPRYKLYPGGEPPSQRREREAEGKDPSELSHPDWKIGEYYPKETWQTLLDVVPGLTKYWLAKIESVTGHVNYEGDPISPEASHPSSPVRTARSSSRRKSSRIKKGPGGEELFMGVGARWIDIYVWAVLLGNTDLALSLLPACQEPMRAAIIGARLCAHMQAKLPLHASHLEAAARTHEAWATNLLELCDSFEDSRRMLVTKSRHWNRTVLQLGVQSGLRDFAAHAQTQTLCDEWLRGNIELETPQVVLDSGMHGLGGALRIMVGALMPFPVPAQLLAPITHWEIPLEKEDEFYVENRQLFRVDGDTTTNLGVPSVSSFYRIPVVKQIVRLGMHLCYVAIMSWTTTETIYKTPIDAPESLGHGQAEILAHIEFHNKGGLEVWWVDLLVWFWTASLAFDEWFKYACSPGSYSMNFWNRYDYGTLACTFTALIFRFFSVKLSVETMAFSVLLIWCRLFKYLQLDQSIGLLVIMVMAMFKDIALWVLLSSVFLGAFTVAFVAIADPYKIPASGDHPLTTPIWAMLGQFDKNEVYVWNESVGELLLGTYLVISQIVLVNLLIAMMGDTYGTIKERADEEWKFGRMVTVQETTVRMSALPPPFNLLTTVPAFLRVMVWSKLTGQSAEDYDLLKDGAEQDENSKEAELAAQHQAKRAKQKVAKKLLRKLKLNEEQMPINLEDGFAELRENQQQMSETLATITRQLASQDKRASTRSAITSMMQSNR